MNRFLLRTAVIVLLVTSCSAPPNVSQAVTDAKILASGVQAAYGALKAFDPALTNTATDAQVQALLDALPGALSQLQAATTAASQASGIRAIEADANGVMNLAAGVVTAIHAPQDVVTAFQAAEVLVPVIEAVANQLVPATTGATATPAVFVSGITVDQARAVLMTVGSKQ